MGRLNFKIVENAPQREIDMISFEKDYVGGELSIQEIKDKYSLTNSEYAKCLKLMKSKGLHKKRIYKQNNPKYYYFNKHWNKWCIVKYNTELKIQEWFGRYDTEEEAKQVVSSLKKCGWDKSQLNNIRKLEIEKRQI